MTEIRAEPIANDGHTIQQQSRHVRSEPIANDSPANQQQLRHSRSEPSANGGFNAQQHSRLDEAYQRIQQLQFQLKESERMKEDKQTETERLMHLSQMQQRQIEDVRA